VPIELPGQTPFPPIGELPYLLTLPGHGFYWFRLATDVPAPAWHEERVAAPRLRTLVCAIGAGEEIPLGDGRLVLAPTNACAGPARAPERRRERSTAPSRAEAGCPKSRVRSATQPGSTSPSLTRQASGPCGPGRPAILVGVSRGK
jgi:hypothetical protein